MTLTNDEALGRHRERSLTETTTETDNSIGSAPAINPQRSETAIAKKHSLDGSRSHPSTTLTSKEALGRHRERSHSSDTNPLTLSNSTDTTMETKISIRSASAITPQRSETAATKRPSRRRHGGHGNRRRFKQHRRSPAHALKKKHAAKPHPPSRHHGHGHGRLSPKSSSPSCERLCGHLWVRPMADRQTHPFRPVAANVAPRVEDVRSSLYGVFPPVPPIPPPPTNPLIRRVAESSSRSSNDGEDIFVTSMARVTDSPVCDEELMWATPQSSSKNSRIAFGVSGKPIRPRHAVPSGSYHTPALPAL